MKDKLKQMGFVVLWGAIATLLVTTSNYSQTPQNPTSSVQSWPPDKTNYIQPAVPEDLAPGGKPTIPSLSPSPREYAAPIFQRLFVRDVVVSNTDPNLTNTDTFGDSEPSIAVDFTHPDKIVLTAFSGSWGSVAPLWYTTNQGSTWTKEFTIPIPPGVPSAFGCPCDQTIDYGHNKRLAGTFLSFFPTDVYSGTTKDPTKTLAWKWRVSGGVAQRTNSAGIGNADQPWLLVNPDPTIEERENIYVAYDDFFGAPDMRVAVAVAADPPSFTVDNRSGFSTGGINPGHRLAVDRNSGAVYSLFQQCVSNCAILANPKTINYILNRSTDGGLTWGLNGIPSGIVVATANSTQPFPKFGTVNALLGGVDHAAVDPDTGDVYVVYGNRDPITGNNRLSIVRLTDDDKGGLTIGPSFFVTGQVQAALPSVAVADDDDGTVGVLYDTFDGFGASGFPKFSAHLALSEDRGRTFNDVVLESFLSPAKDNGNLRQRVLGDYQQLKAGWHTFYGVFTGNGVPFGRPFANTDPIFFRFRTGDE